MSATVEYFKNAELQRCDISTFVLVFINRSRNEPEIKRTNSLEIK